MESISGKGVKMTWEAGEKRKTPIKLARSRYKAIAARFQFKLDMRKLPANRPAANVLSLDSKAGTLGREGLLLARLKQEK